MTGYVLSVNASNDLIEIWRYISQDNIKAADQFIAELLEKLDDLAAFPDKYPMRPELTGKPYRFYPYKHRHFVIYNPKTKPVEIIRVTSTFQNIKDLI